ncbi:MAG: hypothetical protein IKP86_02180 [Anaerolineaceae bacterium]|nr:hypothetical protein [Anaerolineaceae bacterium]
MITFAGAGLPVPSQKLRTDAAACEETAFPSSGYRVIRPDNHDVTDEATGIAGIQVKYTGYSMFIIPLPYITGIACRRG